MGAGLLFRRAASAAAFICVVVGAAAAAQDTGNDAATATAIAATSASTVGDQCELHVWPSNGLRSVYHGWLHGGIVDGAVTGRDGYPPVPADPLTAGRQVDLLEAAGLDDILGRPDYVVVVHPEPLTSTAIRQSQSRMAASPSSCYSELILEDVFFQEDIVNGGSLKSLTRFRDFGPGNGPPKQFGTWTRTPLKFFPPKEPRLNQAALNELDEAFRANLVDFANMRDAGPKKKRR